MCIRRTLQGVVGAGCGRPLLSAGGDVPCAETILKKMEIDHTVINLIVIDE
jgi:hypothetical protein